MNYELFIAKRIITAKRNKSSISSPIIKIAVSAIALGIVIMMIAISTGVGLQHKIREKITGFNGDIQITSFDNNNSEITLTQIVYNEELSIPLTLIDGVRSFHEYATKPGIIRSETDFEGVICKGVTNNYDWSFFKEYLVQGNIPNFSNELSFEAFISEEIANAMQLKVGDQFNVLFVRNEANRPPWIRVLTVTGIYNTGFYDFDKNMLFFDIRHIQKMNDWQNNEVGGIEVLLEDFSSINEKTLEIYTEIPSLYNTQNSIEKFPALFEWISLFDNNIYVIIVIMIIVAGINMISVLLVLILERTQMIGILKALGSNNISIRKIFLYNASYLIAKGLLWGNAIGISILFIQKYFEVITLNPENYYVTTVPVYFSIPYVIILNIGTLLLCLIMLLIPTQMVSKINPATSIKFE